MDKDTIRRTQAEHRQRDMERIQSLCLLDDVFMKVVLKDNIEGVQDIIRVLLKRQDITVLEVRTQDELTNLVGHSVRIDVLARDTAGNYFNIEIQRSESGADPRRARYNLGAVDWHTFPEGADYSELSDTYVIFITETDIFGKGLPLYTVNRFIEETMERFEDGGHILYANGSYQGEDEIGRLMADFRETDPGKMHHASLADRARHFKNFDGGMTFVSRFVEEIRAEVREEEREEGRIEGRAEGRAEEREKARRNMIAALLLGYTEEELLHDARFSKLHITREEIDAVKRGEYSED